MQDIEPSHLLQNLEINDDSVGTWECSCGAWQRAYPHLGQSTVRDSWLGHVAGTRPSPPDRIDKATQWLVLIVCFIVSVLLVLGLAACVKGLWSLVS